MKQLQPVYCPKPCNTVVGKMPAKDFERVEVMCPKCQARLVVTSEIVLKVKEL